MSQPKPTSKATPAPSLKHKLEAVLVYGIYYLFRIIPLDTASAIGGFIGRHILFHTGMNKKVLRNLEKALPELSAQTRQTIARDMWDNLGRVMAEYPHIQEFDDSRVEVVGGEHLQQRIGAGGCILASGHMANWEVLPVTISRLGLPPQLIYRHANNPYVDKLLHQIRTPMGITMARKGVEGARSAIKTLRKGKALGMLIDQKFNPGIAVPFFGRPAMSAPAVVDLAKAYHAPIVMIRIERTHGAHFRMTALPPVWIGEDEPTYDHLAKVHAQLESWIRERPAQWLWLHRRWAD